MAAAIIDRGGLLPSWFLDRACPGAGAPAGVMKGLSGLW
jgi:hypothetical protein